MGFRQRWAFAALLVATFLLVFFGFDPGKTHCLCKTKCYGTPADCKCKPDKSQDDAKKLGHAKRTEFHREGWVLDCVTWNNKWELPPLDADPHEFLLEDRVLKDGETTKERQDAFREIFRKQYWHARDANYFGLQASGPGALLKNAQGVIAALHIIVAKLKEYLGKQSISILDLACGDLQWMNKFLITRDDVDYVGVDIVPEIIENHKKHFANLPNTRFVQMDIVTTPLNESFDLIICRSVFQYLHQADALKALFHISASGSKYMLATTFPDTTQNGEITTIPLKDRKFPYNLELPPYLLEPPLCTSYDFNVQHLGLWKLPVRQKYEY